MRKFRKFLRVLLILLPFSLLGVCFATEFDGNMVYDGAYIDTGSSYSNREEGLAALEQKIKTIMNGVFFDGFTDLIDGFGKGLRDGKQYSEIAVQNYNEFIPFIEHYGTYGTINFIPGEEETSENWANPSYLNMRIYSQGLALYNGNSNSDWVALNNMNNFNYMDSVTQDITQTSGGIATGSASYGNGVYTINSADAGGGFDLDPTIGRAYVKIDGLYDGGEIAFYSTDPNFDVVLVQGESVDGSDRIRAVENDSTVIVWLHFSSLNYSFTIYTDDFSIGSIPAYEPPVLTYPQKTYIDNSTGDTVTNNYYDEEVHYYNYMTNVINQIANAGSADDFEIDLEWGLLNLPAGVALGVIEGLGEWTDVCSFRTQAITIDLGEHDFTFPALHFEFDAGDYEWLTPFRYIITIFILIGLSRACWKLINDLINSGGNFNAD